MAQAVTATPAALEVISASRPPTGRSSFTSRGGCCDGTSPMCLLERELPPGPADVHLGDVGDVPFYIDADQYERWGRPEFVIDVAPGAADSFSLEGTVQVHFVTAHAVGWPASASGALPASPVPPTS